MSDSLDRRLATLLAAGVTVDMTGARVRVSIAMKTRVYIGDGRIEQGAGIGPALTEAVLAFAPIVQPLAQRDLDKQMLDGITASYLGLSPSEARQRRQAEEAAESADVRDLRDQLLALLAKEPT